MDLTPAQQRFVLHWGEMGARWGINRTVAQIHALLYIVETPLDAEEIAKTLAVARSNVSTSLRELLSWSIVKVVHILGQRKDHYTCDLDVWEMMRRIAAHRKQREIDPAIDALRACIEESRTDARYPRQRFQEALEFFEAIDAWYGALEQLDTEALRAYLDASSGKGPARKRKR